MLGAPWSCFWTLGVSRLTLPHSPRTPVSQLSLAFDLLSFFPCTWSRKVASQEVNAQEEGRASSSDASQGSRRQLCPRSFKSRCLLLQQLRAGVTGPSPQRPGRIKTKANIVSSRSVRSYGPGFVCPSVFTLNVIALLIGKILPPTQHMLFLAMTRSAPLPPNAVYRWCGGTQGREKRAGIQRRRNLCGPEGAVMRGARPGLPASFLFLSHFLPGPHSFSLLEEKNLVP